MVTTVPTDPWAVTVKEVIATGQTTRIEASIVVCSSKFADTPIKLRNVMKTLAGDIGKKGVKEGVHPSLLQKCKVLTQLSDAEFDKLVDVKQ